MSASGGDERRKFWFNKNNKEGPSWGNGIRVYSNEIQVVIQDLKKKSSRRTTKIQV